jgi:hypothetical protein
MHERGTNSTLVPGFLRGDGRDISPPVLRDLLPSLSCRVTQSDDGSKEGAPEEHFESHGIPLEKRRDERTQPAPLHPGRVTADVY